MIKSTEMSFIKAILLSILLTVFISTPVKAQPPAGPGSKGDAKSEKSILEFQQQMKEKMQSKMKNKIKRQMQDLVSNLPDEVVKAQSSEPPQIPSIQDAVKLAHAAAEKAAASLIDQEFHKNGKNIKVPADFKSIQEAINNAASGDIIIVSPGTYYEQLIMKDGVKLVSDSSDHGNELIAVDGAMLKLPRRTLRTIIDGSKTTPSKHGMIDFDPGVERKTIVDGFTIRNLPMQNHHIPGHAHGLNIRGASPVITNCLVHNMGSTGIGNHVVYNDQDEKIMNRDFRWNNIKHHTSPVIYNNIIHSNIGLGIGCNHFASPFLLGNEVFNNNDAELGEQPTPGMGNKHGSFATLIGNIVHDNPGGGIMAKTGAHQGAYGIDRPTHPTILNNVVYDNGDGRPGIAANHAGSLETPVTISGNYVYRAKAVGIGLSKGSVGIVENNKVMHSKQPDIAINDSTAIKLNGNEVLGLGESPGMTIVNKSVVYEMTGNSVESGDKPRFMMDRSSNMKSTKEQI